MPHAALPPPARLRRTVEAALEARKADAEHWAAAVAEAQAAAAATDGELSAQRTQLHKLQADLEAEEQRLRHSLEHANVVRARVTAISSVFFFSGSVFKSYFTQQILVLGLPFRPSWNGVEVK